MTKKKSKPINAEIVHVSKNFSERVNSAIVAAAQVNASEIGAMFLEQALEKESESGIAHVQARVQELVEHRTKLQIQAEKIAREIALSDQRIDAVKTGQFSLDIVSHQLRYKNVLLNN